VAEAERLRIRARPGEAAFAKAAEQTTDSIPGACQIISPEGAHQPHLTNPDASRAAIVAHPGRARGPSHRPA
jgi:hypothetical protein